MWSGQTKSHPVLDYYKPFGGNEVRPRAETNNQENTNDIVVKQSFLSLSRLSTTVGLWLIISRF